MRFVFTFLAVNVLLFLIWCAIVFGQVGGATKSSQWVFDAYEKKSAIAKSIKEKKIIIVAGSNALFGIDSKMLSKAFDQPVVNYGVNAGVLLPYTLYKAKEVISKGDTVLIPLEYPMYNYKGMPNSQMIDYIFARDFEAFYSLTIKEQFHMLWDITITRVYDGYKAGESKAVTAGLYGAHNIDEFGDQKNTKLKDRSDWLKNELNSLEANHYGKDFDKSSLGFEYLKEFVSWCENKGAKCVFTPSTLMYFETYKTNKVERYFYENLADTVRSFGWEFVGIPYEYMYNKEFYYNTDYHLGDGARRTRTQKMIFDLKQADILGLKPTKEPL